MIVIDIFFSLWTVPYNYYKTCETTRGDIDWTEGSMCYFPFVYESEIYNNCTTTGNNGVFWCFTDRTEDVWGKCIMDTCVWRKTTGSSNCLFLRKRLTVEPENLTNKQNTN